MSEKTRMRYFITNHQNQPVELHLPSGLRVLGPRSEVEVEKTDLDFPQVQVLRRNRLLTTREAAEAREAVELAKAKPAVEPTETPEEITAPGRRRGAGKKEV